MLGNHGRLILIETEREVVVVGKISRESLHGRALQVENNSKQKVIAM